MPPLAGVAAVLTLAAAVAARRRRLCPRRRQRRTSSSPRDSAFALIKGAAGVPFVPVAFETLEYLPQFRPFRQGWAGVTHPAKPADARWLLPEGGTNDKPASPDGKAGLFALIDADGKPGNRVEETIFGHLLVIPSDGRAAHGATFAFRSTSLAIGRDFANRASRLKAEIDGATLDGAVIGKWLLSSRLERKDSFRWYLPVLSLLGKLGEARGPTLNEVRFAARLRANFKQGLAWMAMDPPEPPALEAPEGPPEPSNTPASDGGRRRRVRMRKTGLASGNAAGPTPLSFVLKPTKGPVSSDAHGPQVRTKDNDQDHKANAGQEGT